VEVAYSAPGVGCSAKRRRDPRFLAGGGHLQPAECRVMNVVEKVQAFKLQTQALDEAQRERLAVPRASYARQ